MNRALAYTLRGRGQHDILFRALVKMWTTKDVEEAERKIASAASLEEVAYSLKTAAKASSVIRCFHNDLSCDVLISGFVTSQPLQAIKLFSHTLQRCKTSLAQLKLKL